MTAATARLIGTEWEAWANRLLAHHFGPENYQRVPSKHKGDAGIEGYCISERLVFQCYGCEEPIGVKERYDKQRDKMTDDIGKFIKNHVVLNGIFKPLKMRRWILFVPTFDSKEIAAHAATKTQEVIEANLSDTIRSFQEELRSEVKELHSFNVQNLAHEAVADWLIRCPLSFPEKKND